jgi:LuxR family transcriptional regulator, activator of tox operons
MDIRKFFASAGTVISSSGTVDFPSSMHGLIAAVVSFDRMDIAQWHVDLSANKILSVSCLGRCGSNSASAPDESGYAAESTFLPGNSAVKEIIDMDGAQLIHNKVSPSYPHGNPPRNAATHLWQCNLVSRKADHRYLISLYRSDSRAGFSSGELCLLQDLSTVVLPIVERHVLILLDAPLPSGSALLRSRFFNRIRERGICLSPRELEVCSAVLIGRTVPELACELVLKCSTVETYIKRAAIKLGVNGRHGLTKWAVE